MCATELEIRFCKTLSICSIRFCSLMKMTVSWRTFFPLMFGVQYLNLYQTQASYQGGGASDSHSVPLRLIESHALTVVQYLNTTQFIQCIPIQTKETVKFD